MIYQGIALPLFNMLYLYYRVEEVTMNVNNILPIQRSRECGQIKFGL